MEDPAESGYELKRTAAVHSFFLAGTVAHGGPMLFMKDCTALKGWEGATVEQVESVKRKELQRQTVVETTASITFLVHAQVQIVWE